MMAHVDETRLNTDLHYRFNYLSKFLNFTSNDMIILNSLAPILLPHISSIVETIYNKFQLLHMDNRVFILNHSYSNISDFLHIYLERILSQSKSDEIFLQYLCQFGECCINENDIESIRTNYTHVNVFLAYIEHVIISKIWNNEQMDMKMKQEAIKTINKFIWIQNNFIIMHYEKAMKKSGKNRSNH